ncbi:hypothetical protein BaRGS_00007590 [Batillaria attramentaria]|uniref:Transcription factor TFIIIC triple barrel domain-containing protein n=1 Tax=Batillaria attramentaria TaxID=370345 RepID=A0ABD0LPG6_9CAEN
MADEWEDESLVVIELTGAKDLQLLKADTIEAQILGPDTERPVMMVNGSTYAGRYEDSLGSCLIFQEKDVPVSSTKSGFISQKPSTNLELVCHSDKKLVLQPAFLLEKASAGTETSGIKAGESSVDEDGAGVPVDSEK